MSKTLIYHTEAYTYLLPSFLLATKGQEGKLARRFFPDGERYLRILDDVRGRDVVILGGSISDADTLEIFDLSCALVRYQARSLCLVFPYFAYATMERAVHPGEVVTAKTRARIFSSIPRAPFGNTAILLDLHAPGIPYYFGDKIHAMHVYAKPVIKQAIQEIKTPKGPQVLAATDAGRAKWVESLAHDLDLPAAFVFKRRVSGSETLVTGMNANVKDCTVIIYDDMIRSGSTLLNAARVYAEAGAAEIFAITTHLLPCEGAIQRLQKSGLFSQVIATDSHPYAEKIRSDFVRIYPIGLLLGKSLADLPR